MKRDINLLLGDILQSIEKIKAYTENVSEEKFSSDSKTQDAVMRRLEVIGEATKNIPDSFRAQYYDIDWKRIAGMRDILIHAYFGVNVERLWVVLQRELPILEHQIREILKEKK